MIIFPRCLIYSLAALPSQGSAWLAAPLAAAITCALSWTWQGLGWAEGRQQFDCLFLHKYSQLNQATIESGEGVNGAPGLFNPNWLSGYKWGGLGWTDQIVCHIRPIYGKKQHLQVTAKQSNMCCFLITSSNWIIVCEAKAQILGIVNCDRDRGHIILTSEGMKHILIYFVLLWNHVMCWGIPRSLDFLVFLEGFFLAAVRRVAGFFETVGLNSSGTWSWAEAPSFPSSRSSSSISDPPSGSWSVSFGGSSSSPWSTFLVLLEGFFIGIGFSWVDDDSDAVTRPGSAWDRPLPPWELIWKHHETPTQKLFTLAFKPFLPSLLHCLHLLLRQLKVPTLPSLQMAAVASMEDGSASGCSRRGAGPCWTPQRRMAVN